MEVCLTAQICNNIIIWLILAWHNHHCRALVLGLKNLPDISKIYMNPPALMLGLEMTAEIVR